MFTCQVTVEHWPTGFVWLFQVDALTAGTIGCQTVRRDHGTGYVNRAAAERAGLAVAKAAGWDSPRVVHC